MSFVKCGLHVVVIVRDEGGTKACGAAALLALAVHCLVTVSHRNTSLSEFQMDVKVVHIFVRAGGSDLFLTAMLMINMAKCMIKMK